MQMLSFEIGKISISKNNCFEGNLQTSASKIAIIERNY